MVTELHRLFNGLKRYQLPISESDRKEIFSKTASNGIYIFFEKSEKFAGLDRIVRIGTHTGDNQFISRLEQHATAPKNRSIFRKNIGRCFLNQENNPYLEIWELDTTSRENKEKYSHKIDTSFEKKLEGKISEYLYANFSFCVFGVSERKDRLFWEGKIASTLAQSNEFKKAISANWLGKNSPKKEIREKGLWQVQKLNEETICNDEFQKLKKIVLQTL